MTKAPPIYRIVMSKKVGVYYVQKRTKIFWLFAYWKTLRTQDALLNQFLNPKNYSFYEEFTLQQAKAFIEDAEKVFDAYQQRQIEAFHWNRKRKKGSVVNVDLTKGK